VELLKWASLGYALSILTRYKITLERLARDKYFIAYRKHLYITVVKSFIHWVQLLSIKSMLKQDGQEIAELVQELKIAKNCLEV
jgi:hypothetical protein